MSLAAPDPDVVHEVVKLSPTERIVAVLVGRGLTMPEIATQLHRTRRTVAKHTEHIHAKLGIRNMASLAAWATRTGLVDHPEWFDERGSFIGGRT